MSQGWEVDRMAMRFWDYNIWSLLVTMSILLGGMLVANMLRRLIKPLRRSLIPSSVLGGFIILLLDFILKTTIDISMFDNLTLEALTYHGLGLGFVAIALKDSGNKEEKKKERSTILNFGATVVSAYLLQGGLGLIITIGLSYILPAVFPASGLLLPMGYGQGPGQAYNWGNIYQGFWGFTDGASFGLTLAAMGFVSASIGGIFYLERLKRKGIVKITSDNDEVEDLTAEKITGEDEIPLSESMDKLTVQIALVFIAYIIAYLMMAGINLVIESGVLGDFGYNTLQPLIWGFNFLFATISATLLKAILGMLKKTSLLKREYTNDFMQTRISGFMFDLMVIASIAAINLSAFRIQSFVISLALLCVVGTVSTYWYCDMVCRRLFQGIRHESFLGLFGMLTGTNSTGIILLREIDPSFKTPVARYLVYQVLYASIFGFPMMLMVGYAPRGLSNSIIILGAVAGFFVIMNILLFRQTLFSKRIKTDK